MKWLAVALWGIIIGGLLGMREAPPVVAQEEAAIVLAGRKFQVTPTMEVSAGFYDTGGVWCFQVNCQHWGTDLLGYEGTPVYAPFEMRIIALGEYGPGPTWGQYVQGVLPDGAVLYLGHLKDRPALGDVVAAGTLLGFTNGYHHVHMQLAPPNNTGPCAQDGSCLNFMEYFATH